MLLIPRQAKEQLYFIKTRSFKNQRKGIGSCFFHSCYITLHKLTQIDKIIF